MDVACRENKKRDLDVLLPNTTPRPQAKRVQSMAFIIHESLIDEEAFRNEGVWEVEVER